MTQLFECRARRMYGDLEYQQGRGDGEHAITESFHARGTTAPEYPAGQCPLSPNTRVILGASAVRRGTAGSVGE
jgi:hypothetical protein